MTEKLLIHINVSKPYLDEELTVETLAVQLSLPRHILTQIINEKLGKNFYNFINEYSVQEVKQKIESGEDKAFTLFSLALDSGFNSKATFNAAFKKYTNMTPSQYKNLVRV